jgi:hypothetical protein
VLNRAGETTSGTSPYEADALTYLNKIHHGLVAGGLVFDVNVDDAWPWARAKYPYVLELQAPITTGTVTFTNGSDAVVFTSGPAVSVAGWFIRISGESTVYRIASHTAAATAADIDAFYVGTTGSKSYTLFKLDYDLVPTHLYIEAGLNDRLDFIRTGSTEATASLTAGAYTPSALATHVAAAITSAAGGASTYGCTYSALTRKFTLTSDTDTTDVFKFKCATGTNVARSAWPILGFDYTDDTASADSHVSTYIVGGVSRVVAPIRAYRAGYWTKDIEGLDARLMQEDYPLWICGEKTPTHFCILRETADGAVVLRFDSYPSTAMKVEVEVCEVPLDLKDNAASIPKVPRKFADILEYGAAHFILTDKEDDKAATYAQFAAAQLKLMQNQFRSTLKRTDPNFGRTIPRGDMASRPRRLRYGYTADSE